MGRQLLRLAAYGEGLLLSEVYLAATGGGPVAPWPQPLPLPRCPSLPLMHAVWVEGVCSTPDLQQPPCVLRCAQGYSAQAVDVYGAPLGYSAAAAANNGCNRFGAWRHKNALLCTPQVPPLFAPTSWKKGRKEGGCIQVTME